MQRTSLLRVLPLLLVFGGFIGCSKDDSTVDPGTTTTTHPGVGSSYRYHDYSVDSLGAPIEGSDGDDTVNVVMANGSYGGKSGVTTFVDMATGDSTFITYDASGDLFKGETNDDGTLTWLRMPFATSQTVDSTLEGGDDTTHYVQNYKATSLGSADVTVGSAKLSARKVRIQYSLVVTGNDTMQTTGQADYYYIPSIGYFGKIDSQFDEQGIFGFSFHTVNDLTGYTLK